MGYFPRRTLGDDITSPDGSSLPPDSDTSVAPVQVDVSDSNSLPIPAPDSTASAADQAAINNPSPTAFKTLNGVCYPQTTAASLACQKLQQQMNRVASVSGNNFITPDGYVGPATLTLLGNILPAWAGSQCMDVAPQAVTLTGVIQSMADNMGASASVSKAPPPSGNAGGVLAPSGKILQGPVLPPQSGNSILDGFNALSTPLQIGVVALGAGILYMVATKSKKNARKGR